MDFSKFLHSGELSDITVVVDSKAYKIHKFPICIKSDYFRTLALNSHADSDNVTLDDFPGGSETFQQVVDYCYNVHVDIDADNVCQLRCAAEFLQMIGSGNLVGVTDKFLQETLTSVRAGRKLETVLEMIGRCRRLGTVAEQAGIVEKCIGAIVDTWLVTPIFSRHLSKSSVPSVDTELLLRLCVLPLNWLSDLLALAKEKRVAEIVRASLIQLYVSKALDIGKDRYRTQKERHEEERETGRKEEKQRSAQEEKNPRRKMRMENRHGMEDEEDDDDEEEEEEEEDGERTDRTEEDSNHDGENEANAEESEEKMTVNRLSSVIDKQNSEEFEESQCKAMDDEEIAVVIDALLYENEEEMLSLGDLVSPKWTLTVLDKAISLRCKAQEPLIRLASRHLSRFTAEDLAQVLPDTYLVILREVCGNDEDVIAPDEICRSVDSFLQCLSNRGTLTPDIFRRILETLPEKYRTNEDTLFHALNKLLQSDETDLGDDERQSLLESIDFGRLSEVALNAAFAARLVPAEHVARAALLLGARLRADLDAAQAVVRMQRDELSALRVEREGRSGRKTHHQSPWTTTTTASDGHGNTTRSMGTDFHRESRLSSSTNRQRSAPSSSSWSSKSYGTGTGSTYAAASAVDAGSYGYHRSVVPSSLASDLELQLALSTLGDVAAQDLHYYGAGGGGSGGGGRQYPLPSFGNRDSRFPDPPAYDDADYYRPDYRPLPSGQAFRRYAARHYR